MDPRRNHPAQAAPAEMPMVATPGNGVLGKILAVALLIATLLFIGVYAGRVVSSATADAGIKNKQFQAVFLTNGQVYFGQLSKVDGSYVKLKQIYYLQVQQTVQPKDATAAANNQQVSLAKLGGELHGPEDTMYISRSQVLFWENLKNDGKVAKAITDYKATNK
jgi:hypothetical protein